MQNILATTRRMLPVILANVAAALPVVMMFVFYASPRFEERYLQDRRDSTRVAVQTVIGILAAQQARVDRMELTLGTAQEEARSMIRTLRTNKDDYFLDSGRRWQDDHASHQGRFGRPGPSEC